MSLRLQITLRILLLSIGILILGCGTAIWQARNAVDEEIESSINLALQLIELSFSTTSVVNIDKTDWIYRLNTLKPTRHLKIQLKTPSGQTIGITETATNTAQTDLPPDWFVHWVGREYPQVKYPMTTADHQVFTLMIQANPLDEITEIWQETLGLFIMIFSLIVLIFIAIHLVFNKTLQAIDTIVDTLKVIETGEYCQKLPVFATQEYDSIARAINHMTDVLEITRRKNHSLAQHSLQIQEEERRRLARELHDELGQSLTAIKMMVVTAERSPENAPQINHSIREICDHLTQVVRSMMQQLHPLLLSELGLKAALDDLISRWHEHNPELTITLDCDDRVDQLDDTLNIQLFRVIQECLTNINRHAQARQVKITLKIDAIQPKLELYVNDDGRGCHPDQLRSGFGVSGIRERIASLDGQFSIDTQLGKGLTLQAQIPLT